MTDLDVPKVQKQYAWEALFQGTLYIDDLEQIEALRAPAQGTWTASGEHESQGRATFTTTELDGIVSHRLDMPAFKTLEFKSGDQHERTGIWLWVSGSLEPERQGWLFAVSTKSDAERDRFQRVVRGLQEIMGRADSRPWLQRLPEWKLKSVVLIGLLLFLSASAATLYALGDTALAIADGLGGQDVVPTRLIGDIAWCAAGVLTGLTCYRGWQILTWQPQLFDLTVRRKDAQSRPPSFAQRDVALTTVGIVASALISAGISVILS